MTICKPTDLPPADEVDIPALKAKYRRERDKRLRKEAGEQYVRPVGEFAGIYERDPHMPVMPREAISEALDVVILGGGWTGLMAGYHLRQAGVADFRHIEHGGDFGGVWYWNRYPGIQCDNDAYCYLPLLEETGFMPSKKFADGWEIQGYCRQIAEKYGFYDKALMHTIVTGLRWDEGISRWRIATNRGDELRARHVVMAGGVMNMPKLPGIPGLSDFAGKVFHSARWDYDYSGGEWRNPVLSRLHDKRVAIIGTGATSIQAVPFLGRYAKQVYVLQRTPSTVDERQNPPTDPAWAASLAPGWQKARQANYHRGAMESFLPGEPDLAGDFWTEISRNLSVELEREGWPQLTPAEIAARREVIDFRVMERIRRRIASIVEDPATAEALKPYFRQGCKRPLSNDDYFPTFNLPHVQLIDVSATQGVERITDRGFVANGTEYEVDCIIFASGFEVSGRLERRWGIEVVEGRGGLSIYDHWAEGPRSFHGVMTHGFPNMFYTGYIQGGLNASTTEQFRSQCEHIAFIIAEALRRGAEAVEPCAEGEAEYVRHFDEIAVDASEFIRECTPNYYANEGDSAMRWVLLRGYGHGWAAFVDLLAGWRERGDMAGLVLTGAAATAEPVS
jgi:cation diffusion facilitator CzcD-associated flavoprotein CzcO